MKALIIVITLSNSLVCFSKYDQTIKKLYVSLL